MTGRTSTRRLSTAAAGRVLPTLCGLVLVVAASLSCVSQSKAKAQAHAAYMAGQREALVRMQQMQTQGQGPCVTVNGEVSNHIVPWTQGMTLAKALVAAEYVGATDPAQILILHNGVATRVQPSQLVSGADIPLQPGDVVQLLQQAPGANPQTPAKR